MRLYLVRHGRTSHNVNHLAQGHLDTPLDDLGRAQALSVVAALHDKGIKHIWSSDLERSMQTASPLSFQLDIPIQETSLLRERGLGELEGAPLTRLRKAFDEEVSSTQESRYKVRPLGAESAYDVMERAEMFLSSIDSRDTAAIFTHGMMKEVLLCALLKAPVECSRSFQFDNGSITTLRSRQGVWVLEGYNQTDHHNDLKISPESV